MFRKLLAAVLVTCMLVVVDDGTRSGPVAGLEPDPGRSVCRL